MASLTSAVNVQVDAETKKEATKVLNSLGLSMSSAINIFLKQVVNNDGLPFEVVNKKPSRQLRKALKEVEKMEKHPERYKSYHDVDEFLNDMAK